ncbi:hypothetical protein D3870_00700 [Noviherbaspirillum cavernae]|uniref:DUF2059 domain-containing protein n=1 Tax=Noviherbaspirillum cavernae TaxID=2320862 RepID=A0A418WWZ6_9BURK|nr:hypothetical protein [Noviherbaspirillum cavernae]RJG04732.1 hypothetical protein D3870_00700 [Noviherbaspirillum cavernae]
MNNQRYLAALLSLTVLAASALAAPSAQEAALEFVSRQRLGDNLSNMSFATATRTQTFAMLVSKLGADGAKASLSKELQASLPRFQARWNKNLANAYAKNFSVEELTSLAADGRASKYAEKVAERQTAVGAEMRAASEAVLSEYVTEALGNAFAKIPK